MKVMYISHSSNLGGAEQSLIDLLKYIKNEINATVIVPKEGPLVDILNDMQLKCHVYDYPQNTNKLVNQNKAKNAGDFVKTYDVALQLADLIIEQDIDLIHTNSTVVDVGAIAAAIAEKPHIWHFREFMEEDFNLEYYNKQFKKCLFQNSPKCISISKCIHKKYLITYEKNSTVIYNGIDSDRFDQDIKEGLPKNREFYVAGSVSRNKGQLDAIKAIGHLVDDGYKNIKLYIIGSMSKQDRWNLEKYIKACDLQKNIELCAFAYSLSELRKRCICSITTSKMEALGRVTVEAMLAGNLVIGANTGGTVEIIGPNSEYGFLYEQGNSRDLARKMKQILEMSETNIMELLVKSQKYAKERFNPISYADKLLEIYIDAINKYEKCEELKQIINACYEKTKTEKDETIMLSRTSIVNSIFEKMKEREYIGNLLKRNISHLAVYGMGKIGMELVENLEDTEICLDYVIDQNEGFLSLNYDYYKPYDELPVTDAIIITAIGAEEVVEYYNNRYPYMIIKMEELV